MAHEERSAGFIAFSTPRLSRATALPERLVREDVSYLLLDYGRHWDFPKGHVERGEDDLAAAVRELEEETGLAEPQVIPGFRHEIVYFFRHRKQGLVRKTVVFFLARVPSDGIILSHEHVGYAFFPIDAALKRVTFATARDVLRRAHAHLVPADATVGLPRPTQCRMDSPSLFAPPTSDPCTPAAPSSPSSAPPWGQ